VDLEAAGDPDDTGLTLLCVVKGHFEQFLDRHGFVAVRAVTAESEAAGEGVAVRAALLAEGAGVAGGAEVDGVLAAGASGQ